MKKNVSHLEGTKVRGTECFIKKAEATTAEQGEARRWSTEQASAKAEP